MNKIEPVYPKPNSEARKRALEDFYRKVKNTRWEEVEEKKCAKKGRKPKEYVRANSEHKPVSKINKYNWLNE